MKTLISVLLMSFLCDMHASVSHADSKNKAKVRKPSVAGQFYPSDPEKLAKAIDGYLGEAVRPSEDRPIAIVSPHAGYIFSGQIAADAYKQASKHDYDLVVILGVNHTTAEFQDVSIYPGSGFETPLGVAVVDEELAETLVAADKRFTFDESVHTREHSIEVQLPFIQRIFPEAKILPVIVATSDPILCAKFGEALAKAIEGRKALIVASSDLSHFPEYADAERVDRRTLEAMSTLDTAVLRSATSEQMSEGVANLGTCACGESPVIAAMAAARKLGATGARIISYANSGDTSVGDRTRVVGYGAVAFVVGKDSDNLSAFPMPKTTGGVTLTENEKTALLSFARKTIQRYLATETTPLARGFDPALEHDKGAFVTLRKNGDLRGCIGHMAQDMPLCQVVGYCALQAAFNDQRFSPVEPGELGDIEIEISVLTPYQRVDGYDDIQIGRDGVLMEKNGRSAVFLPSVAVEQGWNREETLSHLSAKAGLPPDAWKKDATFYTFRAIAFRESELH
jgi:hypothetical protein